MKIIKYIIFTLFVVCGISANAQTIKGKIYTVENGKKIPLPYAGVVWTENKTVGAVADNNGKFSIKMPAGENLHLAASFMGYLSDTLQVSRDAKEVEFVLYEEAQTLAGATVTRRQKGSFISKLAPAKTEIITSEGLAKMACCTLAESFENSASISVGYSDAVSGARQIRMLGLAGIYTQMLDENIPAFRGISSTYGLSFTPGQWLESIQVSKGTSSVLNGYEAITGQINLEHRKPNRSEPLYLNLYGDSDGRLEANISSGIKINDRLSTIIFAHGSTDTKTHDKNDDTFADMPKTRQMNFGNRWLYTAKNNMQVRFGLHYLQEERNGGQRGHGAHGIANPYLSNINNKNFRTYAKLGVPVNASGSHSLGFIVNYTYHKQNSFFGNKNYDATQNTLYANALLQSSFDGAEKHRYTVGATFIHDNYNQNYFESSFAAAWNGNRVENIGGAFGEYTFKPNDNFDLIAGIRADRNGFYKTTFVTPRAHLRYNISENTTVRASVGRGFRSPNAIADNIGILATGRRILIDNDLQPEKAWTFGFSFTQNFKLNEKHGGYVSFDAFRTDFQNQTVVDVEESNQYIKISNLNGKSYSNCFQIDFSIDPIERFNVFLTFRYNQTKVNMSRGLLEKPLTDRFKALVNLSYATKFEKWKFDFTAQLNGSSRIPAFAAEAFGREHSKVYPMFFAQITKKYHYFDIYLGCENIGNYTQKRAIINAENPFDTKFDASNIYAPLMGRKFYLGFRLRLGKV